MSDAPPELQRPAGAAPDADRSARPVSSAGVARRGGAAPLSLNAFLPYRLNILAQTVSASFAAAYSQAFGITAPEWRIVSTLGEFRQMTATEISNHSGMHKATISRAVLSLDRRGLLSRNPSTADRREEILTLTADGRRVYETIAPMALRYEQSLLEGLRQDDVAALDRLIRHLMERARAPRHAPE
jgi:DNA-binding MarR family transcriptional regulator